MPAESMPLISGIWIWSIGGLVREQRLLLYLREYVSANTIRTTAQHLSIESSTRDGYQWGGGIGKKDDSFSNGGNGRQLLPNRRTRRST